MLILRTEGRVTFANVANVGDKMQALAVEAAPRVMVLECSGIPDIEYTALVDLIGIATLTGHPAPAQVVVGPGPSA